MAAKLLLIDDDVPLADALRSLLIQNGFQVEVAYDAISGLQKAYGFQPNAIVLDIMLPDMDGWQTCRRFREMTDVPIIMLTALDSVEDVVQGLDLGADDYIVKPVSSGQLLARIRAALRRDSRSDSSAGELAPTLKFDNLMIDLENREVTLDGKRVQLSRIEFRLLSVLTRQAGRVLSHEYLLSEVWGPEYIGELDYLRLYISYLRRKIEKDPSEPSLIHNEWGVGYRFGYRDG